MYGKSIHIMFIWLDKNRKKGGLKKMVLISSKKVKIINQSKVNDKSKKNKITCKKEMIMKIILNSKDHLPLNQMSSLIIIK